jgi:hypothetical protein
MAEPFFCWRDKSENIDPPRIHPGSTQGESQRRCARKGLEKAQNMSFLTNKPSASPAING